MSISSYFNVSGDKILSKFKDKAISRLFVDSFVGFYIEVFFIRSDITESFILEFFCEKYDAKNFVKFKGEHQG